MSVSRKSERKPHLGHVHLEPSAMQDQEKRGRMPNDTQRTQYPPRSRISISNAIQTPESEVDAKKEKRLTSTQETITKPRKE
jgi:hypothetical protein